jgi:CheY-like chemotaxis protein
VKRGFTLLLVEDCENDRLLFRKALERSSRKAEVTVRLVVVRDGEEALRYIQGKDEFLDRCKNSAPHVIVTDLKMPRCNGLDLMAWLKEHEDYRAIPKIMLSGSSEERDVADAYALGANAFFQKPASYHGLQDLIFFLVSFWAHAVIPALPAPRKPPTAISSGS